jgi:catechol 2,3-dioxygenase-like lactoylglutathione lyase family enzyme
MIEQQWCWFRRRVPERRDLNSPDDGQMNDAVAVTEMRLVVTVADYPAALRFYRDVLGLREHAEFISDGGGHVTILEAGRATLEISDERNAEFVDEVEVGRRVAGQVRVAFEVPDPSSATRKLVDGGAELIAGPTATPWNSLNSRLQAPAGLQLTLFGPAPPAATR